MHQNHDKKLKNLVFSAYLYQNQNSISTYIFVHFRKITSNLHYNNTFKMLKNQDFST